MDYLFPVDKDRIRYILTELNAVFPFTSFMVSAKKDNKSLYHPIILEWDLGPQTDKVREIIECLDEDMKNLYGVCIINAKYPILFENDRGLQLSILR